MKNKSLLYIGLGIICIISSLALKGTLINVMASIGNFASGFIIHIQNFILTLSEVIFFNGNNAIGLIIIVAVIIILISVSKEK